MISKYYLPTSKKVWQGRIDDLEDYDAFRWHQWIKPIDLETVSEDELNIEKGLGICILGFCCDQGVTRNKGRSGASKGPASIRKEMTNLPCHFTQDLKLFDAGNLITQHLSLEEAQDLLAVLVSKILNLGLFPIILGGGHEIAFGHYKGLKSYLNKEDKLGIINFDAHFDIRPYPNGGSSGTMFRQIYDWSLEDNFHYGYMAIGIQRRSNTIALFKSAKDMGIKHFLAKDMVDQDIWHMQSDIQSFVNDHDHLYLTICSDVFSSAFAPGVSAAQVLGLHPEKVIKILKYLLSTGKVVSFDIAEVSPRFDHDNTTANLAATLIFAVVNTLATSKGLRAPFL